MTLEDKLRGWTGPSSKTEQDKQDRTERMIRKAVQNHAPFANCTLKVYAKGSYANNTNVKADSDVDIAVQCTDYRFYDGPHPNGSGSPYRGIWKPAELRSELAVALEKKFPGQVDSSGSTAFRVNSNTARVDADVVPCFNYTRYFDNGTSRNGSKVFKKDLTSLVNYPEQQLANGRQKYKDTGTFYKQAVRILKRVENAMVADGSHREASSFFVECLVYNCPNQLFLADTWVETIRDLLQHMRSELKGSEPTVNTLRWHEVNDIKFLFHGKQVWTRADGRDFARSAWKYLGYGS